MRLSAGAIALALCAVGAWRCVGTPAAAPSNADAAGPRVAGELRRKADGLFYIDPSGAGHKLSAEATLPYCVVSLGPPVLLTAIGPDLLPATFAGAAGFSSYPGALPITCRPPVVALSGPLIGAGEAVTFLKPDGTAGLRVPAAQLLAPASGDPGSLALLALPGSNADEVWTLGEDPVLCAVDCSAMQERWRLRIECGLPVAGIDLLAQCEMGSLLALQHDYEKYSWTVVSPAGKQRALAHFEGQPAVNLVWPGPVPEFSFLRCGGKDVQLAVHKSDGSPAVLSFDLSTGGIVEKQEAISGKPPRDERASLPSGQVRQGLLPTAAGDRWSIPALTDGQGRVLVVGPAGAGWVAVD